ncbi:putative retrotransposon protein [Hordeum vulgare]|nr:putative retrotransposon protein [Hordeum vulgare]
MYSAPNAPNQGKGHGAPGRNQAPRNQQYHIRGRVNHISAEEAQEDPDCILEMFLVNSTPSTILFDCDASHSFVTQKFAVKCGLKPTLLNGQMEVATVTTDLP